MSAALHEARSIERSLPGHGQEHTICPACHTVLIERDGFEVRVNRTRDGRCPACDTQVDGVEMGGVNTRDTAHVNAAEHGR